jgi:hypothetical protein
MSNTTTTPVTTTTTPAQTLDVEKRTAQYVEVRDAIQKLQDKHELELKPLLEIKELLSARIQAFMRANNLQNLRTRAGTCTLSVRHSATIMDGEAFMSLVKEGNWDLIERRANSTAVKDWVEQHNELPAGVNLTAVQTLGVRRPAKSLQEALKQDTNNKNKHHD